jgi:YD repeat-containing protein
MGTHDDVIGCAHGAFGGSVLVTCCGYDDNGRQDRVWHPDGTLTRTEYDRLGRVVRTTQNATAAGGAPQGGGEAGADGMRGVGASGVRGGSAARQHPAVSAAAVERGGPGGVTRPGG